MKLLACELDRLNFQIIERQNRSHPLHTWRSRELFVGHFRVVLGVGSFGINVGGSGRRLLLLDRAVFGWYMVGWGWHFAPFHRRSRGFGWSLFAAIVLVEQLVELLGPGQVVGVAVALARWQSRLPKQ